MKRCPNCHIECNDQSKFCPQCGGGLETVQAQGNDDGFVQRKKQRSLKVSNKLIGIAATAVVVIVIIVLCVSLMGGRNCQQLVKDLETGMREADGDIIIKLLPPEMVEYQLEQTDQSIVQIKEEIAESVEYTMEKLSDQLGEDYTFSLTLDEQRNFDEDELNDIRRSLAKNYHIERDSVKEGAALDVVFFVKGEGLETSNMQTMDAVKIGKDWYLIDISMLR